DSLLVKSGSGALTFGQPTSAGVPPELARLTLALPYNDLETVASTFRKHGDKIAAVIVEPVAGNMNLVMPHPEFLKTLRNLCTTYGSILIFDEVMTGFRISLGGAQQRFGIQADLTTLGKIIGGGLPVGAFGGRRDIMKNLAPNGPVYQAGTLSGNPVAVAAGLATLNKLKAPGFYDNLENKANRLIQGLNHEANKHGINFTSQAIGGMFGIYFQPDLPTNLEEVKMANLNAFKRFFHAMLSRNIYLAPSAFEAGFISITHSDRIIDETIRKASEAFLVNQ
ncbi:MAG: glutamate-1-semialdehyde 2,1-aminomutase, partial [Pseudomonadota bacterium]|nr:glutamate-1-semialdehyde 2,1-aminomutase [Pseudomonadota bacterium]